MQRYMPVRWLVLLSLLFLVSSSTGLVFAQNVVNKDSSTVGTLSANQQQVQYNVAANAGDTLTIEVLSITQGLLVQAFILAPDSQVVEALINAEESLAIRTQAALTQSGTYTILVSSRNDATGDFILTLSTGGGNAGNVAPDPCEDYMDDVLPIIDNICSTLSRNEICYGNSNITAQPNALQFANLGDVVSLSDLFSLELSALNQNTNEWGVAVMNVQANLPDTLPGQNVTIVAFGDVSMTPTVGNNFGTMQSFYFSTGVGQSTCNDTPADGILIETPEDAGIVELTINDTNMQIASTIFLSLDTNAQQLQVNTLEGVAVVESQGAIRLAPAGNRVTVPTDNTGRANGEPLPAEPIDEQALPVPARRVIQAQPETQPSPAPSQPPRIITPTPFTRVITPTPIPSPTELVGIVLPATGPCVLSTFEPDVNVNVRSGPGTSYSVVGTILPTRSYDVIGRNADESWYQISTGWVAAFVTRRGGDQCFNVPITFVEPTATNTSAPATPIPTLPGGGDGRIAGDNEQSVTVDYNNIRQQYFLTGAISYSQGDRSDGIDVRVRDLPSHNRDRYLYYNISCSGTGTQYIVLGLPDGRVVRCNPNYYLEFIPSQENVGKLVVTWEQNALPEGLYVEWSMSIGIRR